MWIFRTTYSRTIYSNNEKSYQFLNQNAFLTCSRGFLISNKLDQLEFKLENILGFRNQQHFKYVHRKYQEKLYFLKYFFTGLSVQTTICMIQFFFPKIQLEIPFICCTWDNN